MAFSHLSSLSLSLSHLACVNLGLFSYIPEQMILLHIHVDAAEGSYAPNHPNDREHYNNRPIQPKDWFLSRWLEHNLVEQHGQDEVKRRIPKRSNQGDDVSEEWKHRRQERYHCQVKRPEDKTRHYISDTVLPLFCISSFAFQHFRDGL